MALLPLKKFEGLGFGNEQASLETPVLYPAHQGVFSCTTHRLDRPYSFLKMLWQRLVMP